MKISTHVNTTYFFCSNRMERLQRAFRNFKRANETFRRESANVQSRWPTSLYWPRVKEYNRQYQNAHERMLVAHDRRTNAAANFRSALRESGIRIRNAHRLSANQIMNIVNRRFAPPNRPGGFGGIEYELASLRWRKKPNRTKSASPKRRRSPIKRASSARF